MKLRCVPEDFTVTEITSVTPSAGKYGLYRLRKRSIGTPEAIEQIRRNWNLATQQVEHAGLKDRHADTTQFITIRNGPRAGLMHGRVELEYLGQTGRAIAAEDIVANEFQIVLRHLTPDTADAALTATVALHGGCVPNYFDEQRFGSLGASKKFVAAELCRRDYEQALWLALAEQNAHDDASERHEKKLLRDHWGDWLTCKGALTRSHRRSIVTYLVDHPENFRKAFALVNPQLRGLYLSALQSAVWNRMLASRVDERHSGCQQRVSIGDAVLPLPVTGVVDAANIGDATELPLPSARCRNLSPDLQALSDTAAAYYGLTLADMKISFPRDRFFSRGVRQTSLSPDGLVAHVSDDHLHPGRKALTLAFSLPRGCYATMIVKAITTSVEEPELPQ